MLFNMRLSLLFWTLCGSTGAKALLPRSYDGKCLSGVYLIYARGTNEKFGQSAVQPAVSSIVKSIPDSAAVEVVYPANNSLSPSIPIGVDYTQARMTEYATACPNSSIALMGYSQGAMVIGNALAGNNNTTPVAVPISQTIGKTVVAVVMYGDVNRAAGQGITADTIDGQTACNVSSSAPRIGPYYEAMQFYANRLAEWCNAGDPICCHTGKDLNDHNSYFTSGDNLAVLNFVRNSVGLNTVTSGSLSMQTRLVGKSTWSLAALCLVGAILSPG